MNERESDPGWGAMWDLFHQACALPTTERAAFLDRACGGDGDLRRQLEELLASHEATGGLLDDTQAPLAGLPDASLVGSRVDHYQVLEVIGEGGMGVVYGARQEDPIRRDVALKVVKQGMDTGEFLARFESERQALAMMSHPGIASIYDAGVTPSGRPYFVMERVHGLPITEYCDRQEVSVDGRLKLFIGVCKAVHHAHQKAVMHRDLKPSNVLVCLEDGEPAVKVIDFGVAKAVSQPLTEHSPHTRLGGFIGTPEYISPEQAEMSGLDIDIRTDVYSLGVVLYEMLTGVLPFDSAALRQQGLGGIQRYLRDQPTPRPSTRFTDLGETSTEIARRRSTDAASHQRRLRGDLDWIVLKALEKDRTQRYDSASALAADIERHLRQLPVEAGPPSVSYRFGKLIRRHRLAVGFTAALLLAILTALGGISWAFLDAQRARQRAEVEARKAERVSEFFSSVLQGATPEVAQGMDTALLEKVLMDASERIQDELGDQPEVAAVLHHNIGAAFSMMGRFDKAEPQIQKALDLNLATLGPEHEQTLGAETELGLLLWDQSRLEESAELTRKTLEVKERVFGPNDQRTLISMNNLGLVLKAMGRLDEAEPVYRRVLEIRRQVLGVEDLSTQISMSNLAMLLRNRGQHEEAEALLRETLEVQIEVLGESNPETLVTMDILGATLKEMDRLEEAEELVLRALDGSRRVFGEGHPDTLGVLDNLALLQMAQGKLELAEKNFRQVLAGVESTLGERHRFMVGGLGKLARCLHKKGQLDESRALYDRAIAMTPEVFPPEHHILAVFIADRAGVLIDQGELERPESDLLTSLETIEKALGPAHSVTRRALEYLVRCYELRGDAEQASHYAAKLAAVDP